MNLEGKMRRRLLKWQRMAKGYREAEQESRNRIHPEMSRNERRDDEQEADLNQDSAEAMERCVADLADDLSAMRATSSPPATRPTSIA